MVIPMASCFFISDFWTSFGHEVHRVRGKLKVMEAKKAEKLTLIVSNGKPLKLWKTSHVYEMKAGSKSAAFRIFKPNGSKIHTAL